MTTSRTGTCLLALCLLAAVTIDVPALADDARDERGEVDWKKPLVYSGSAMLVGFAALEALDVFDDDPSRDNFRRAFQKGPVEDDDSEFLNLVLHPLWGSETYLRAREGNMGILGSIGFSLLMSVTWEYLIESWVEQPSQQDLVFTTGIGWMIGEWRYRMKNRLKPGHDWWLDPLDTTLQRIRIGRTRDREGKTVPVVMFSFQF